jgi:hypothetical protein
MAALIPLPINSYSQGNKVRKKDYQIQIPEGWKSLSTERIKDLQLKNTPDIRTYIIGYSEKDTSGNETPFFIADYNEIPESEAALFRDIIITQTEILKKTGIDGKLTVDSSQYKFYVESYLQNKCVFLGFSPGGNGILYLQYYSDLQNKDQDKIKFLAILNSIEHFYEFKNQNIY